MRLLPLPGVFRPHSDSWMLCRVMAAQPQLVGGDTLDLCTGSGLLAVGAAGHGARTATAVDLSRRAVLAARLNARVNGVRVRALRGDLFEAVGARRFDVITANPPYVPAAEAELPRRGSARATDAGLDGRVLLDRICEEAPRHLKPGGVVLLTHSSVVGTELTVRLLEHAGLEAEVAESRRSPFGRLLRERAELLEERGLVAPGVREEEVVVIRARQPRRPRRPRGRWEPPVRRREGLRA